MIVAVWPPSTIGRNEGKRRTEPEPEPEPSPANTNWTKGMGYKCLICHDHLQGALGILLGGANHQDDPQPLNIPFLSPYYSIIHLSWRPTIRNLVSRWNDLSRSLCHICPPISSVPSLYPLGSPTLWLRQDHQHLSNARFNMDIFFSNEVFWFCQSRRTRNTRMWSWKITTDRQPMMGAVRYDIPATPQSSLNSQACNDGISIIAQDSFPPHSCLSSTSCSYLCPFRSFACTYVGWRWMRFISLF